MVINIVVNIRCSMRIYVEIFKRSFDHNTAICVLDMDTCEILKYH